MTASPPMHADEATAGRHKTECILDAARHVFLETGYGASTVDAIATAAGVSKATIYTRFPSKQAMFAAVIQRECRACTQRMALAEESSAPDLANALRRIADTLLDIILLPQNLAIQRLVIAEMPRFPELGTVFYESGPAVTLSNLAAFLEREKRHSTLRFDDATVAAQHFISLLRGDIQIRALIGAGDLSDAARRRVADRAVEAFLRVYAETSADAARAGHPPA